MNLLGEDILGIILSKLDIIDIMNFRCTCKSIRDIIAKDIIINVKHDDDIGFYELQQSVYINEYKGSKITKIRGFEHTAIISSKNGVLHGTSIYKVDEYTTYLLFAKEGRYFSVLYDDKHMSVYIDCAIIMSKWYIHKDDIIDNWRIITYDTLCNYCVMEPTKMYKWPAEQLMHKTHHKYKRDLMNSI